MATKKIFFGLVVVVNLVMTLTVLLGSCSATTYKVGDYHGWTGNYDMYYSWTKGKEFHVGDSLVFNYDHNVNDVTQVSGGLKYRFCDSSSPKAVYKTGQDVVNLTEPGYNFFITSNHSLCISGQKLFVLVVQEPPSKSRSSPISPPPPSKSPPPPSKSRPSLPPRSPPSKSRPILTPPPPPSKSRPTPPPPPSKSRPTPPPPPPSKSRPIPPPPPPSNKIVPVGKLYKVGDSRGWSVYNSYYYYSWSEPKEFYVGDNLFFQYNKDLNDVIEISDELEFRSCEPTSRVAEYKTGHDLIKLTKPGVHYFISLKTGLCQAGLKLKVTVRPLPQAVTSPNVPTMRLSPIERLNRWLRSFRPPHH
ncbi:Mavicyanin [Cardamine amara subsp. amara]|uniref:Mavicyanin n=1 Tax=Cardamine amara subsp. amara TaxID=228776 RepID=A0ABD0ZB08_CARAN